MRRWFEWRTVAMCAAGFLVGSPAAAFIVDAKMAADMIGWGLILGLEAALIAFLDWLFQDPSSEDYSP